MLGYWWLLHAISRTQAIVYIIIDINFLILIFCWWFFGFMFVDLSSIFLVFKWCSLLCIRYWYIYRGSFVGVTWNFFHVSWRKFLAEFIFIGCRLQFCRLIYRFFSSLNCSTFEIDKTLAPFLNAQIHLDYDLFEKPRKKCFFFWNVFLDFLLFFQLDHCSKFCLLIFILHGALIL